jgi:hypothetical protein
VFIPFCFVVVAADLPSNVPPQPYGTVPEFKYCTARVRVVVTGDGR